MRSNKEGSLIPEISIGPLTIQSFGLMSMIGAWLSGFLLARRFRELGYPSAWGWELAVITIIVGVTGATVDYVIQNGKSLSDVPSLILSGQGMVWFGGLVSVVGVFVLWGLYRRMPFWDLFASVIYGFIALQMMGRAGCQLSGDGDYGIPWDGPWAMGYPNGTVPTPPGVTVHPTPVYEALGLLVLLIVTWRLRQKVSQPTLFAIWMIGAGLIRFPVEFIRRNPEVFLSLTTAQWFSLVLIIGGIILFALSYKKPSPLPLAERKHLPDLRFFSFEKEEKANYLNLQKNKT